jgi:small subunit ribosomal protein S15
MVLTKDEKKKIIEENIENKKNTGCYKVQIALLSCEIKKLNEHLKTNPFDFHSKRGLLTKNRKRNTLIKHSKKNEKLN